MKYNVHLFTKDYRRTIECESFETEIYYPCIVMYGPGDKFIARWAGCYLVEAVS